MREPYKITEYDSFVMQTSNGSDTLPPHYFPLPQRTFEALESFILSNRSKDTDALELLGLSAKKGFGRVITAKNYVGVITMNDGTTIEILPKIFSNNKYTEQDVKKLLVDMLKSLKDSPYKSLQTANVNIEKMSLFEIFIRMFIDEVIYIEKRGLKSGYQTVERNEGVFRGKLKVSEHIKFNFAHKERCYVEYDEFNMDRPENRLIKSTLLYLHKHSQNSKNRSDMKNLLNSFSEVSESTDIDGDFSRYVPDRNMKDYSTALMWCKVFLSGKSFTSFSGSDVAYALLFPMETLFESYIAQKLRRELDPKEFSVSVQDKSYHLFDQPRQFRIRPDIVVKRKADGAVFILDTKWKLLSTSKVNYGISQSDMYQMYVYQKKYQAAHIFLLYPVTDSLCMERQIPYRSYDGVNVTARFIDMISLKESMSVLSEEFSQPEMR